MKPPTLWKRILLFLSITILLRLLWVKLGSYYLSFLLWVVRRLAPVWGLHITRIEKLSGARLIFGEIGGRLLHIHLATEQANSLGLDLIVFLGLVLGLSWDRFRFRGRKALLSLAVCLLVLAGRHVVAILWVLIVVVPAPGPLALYIRMLTALLFGMGPLVPFLLWIVCFTDIPRQALGRRPDKPRSQILA